MILIEINFISNFADSTETFTSENVMDGNHDRKENMTGQYLKYKAY